MQHLFTAKLCHSCAFNNNNRKSIAYVITRISWRCGKFWWCLMNSRYVSSIGPIICPMIPSLFQSFLLSSKTAPKYGSCTVFWKICLTLSGLKLNLGLGVGMIFLAGGSDSMEFPWGSTITSEHLPLKWEKQIVMWLKMAEILGKYD